MIILCFSNCGSRKIEKPTTTKFTKKGRFLIKETYDSTNKPLTKQYFNNDTVPDGAAIEFYENGNIGSWKWFIPGKKNPTCGLFYHEDGSFDTLKGRPYLGMSYDVNHSPVVEVINPPQLKIEIGYKEIFNNIKVNGIIYDPTLTDTIAWVALDEYHYVKGHEYKIFFRILDTIQKKLLYQDSTHLAQRD